MLNPFRKKETIFDEAIEKCVLELKTYDPESTEFATALDQLERLTKLRDASRFKVDPNTMIVVAGNLLGIWIIVGHERVHVMASKAVNFVIKPR